MILILPSLEQGISAKAISFIFWPTDRSETYRFDKFMKNWCNIKCHMSIFVKNKNKYFWKCFLHTFDILKPPLYPYNLS